MGVDRQLLRSIDFQLDSFWIGAGSYREIIF